MDMTPHYVPSLVGLSFLVAILASYVALNFAYSVTQAKGRAQAMWLAFGALAMGVGIWSMHFVGMLAFEMPGMAMAYDVPLMILSIVVAVVASALALFIVSRPIVHIGSVAAGGVAMAAAIAGMHYIGMFSMRMQARIEWDLILVSLSILIALVASFAALAISIKLRDKPDRTKVLGSASVLMGIAIAGMHYTGMAAATFLHDSSVGIHSSNLMVTSSLSFAVISTTLLILVMALVGSIGQRILAIRAREAADTLSSSEEKFRNLVEAVEDYAIFMLDTEGRITTWNSGAEKITGYPDEDVIGKHVSILCPPEECAPDVVTNELREAREDGRHKSEAYRVRKDGRHFLANITIHPLYDHSGHLTGYSKVLRDITQLRESEVGMRSLNERLERRVHERTLELEQREAQLRSIANAIPTLVAQIDSNEKILFANEAFCEWFDIKPNRIGNVTFRDVLGPVRYPDNKPFINRVLSGETVTYERESVSGGNRANFLINFLPEVGRSGRVESFVLVANDVKKFKEIEAELKTAKEAAEVANETKSAFLANMSHEIRTPLGAVLGFSELLAAQDLSASEKQNAIEIVKRNGRLLSNIINDILDLSKVEAGKLEVEKVPIPFAEVLSDVGSLLNLEANEKGVQLTVTSEGPVPSTIKTDPLRLRQILLNIIGNAIKFTSRGSVDVRVKMDFENGSDKLAFFVKDTGEGIAKEQADRLFTPFTQADPSTTRRFGGTGLGLVLSKKLARALGGDLVLQESSLGIGSTFKISIDPGTTEEVLFRSYDSDAPKNVTPLLKFDSPRRDLKNLNVLLVDDSPDNQALIKKILTMAGAQVSTAGNGREGIESATAKKYDVVLMDLQMPIMDGYEATKQLRVKGYRSPIVALTAHAMKEERRKCLENGFDDHLTKPVDRKLLVELLAKYRPGDESSPKLS